MTRVDGQIDRDRDGHAAEAGENRQRQPAALAQLSDVELAPHLEPDDEEEKGHQAGVDPVAEILGDSRAADADREARVPDIPVGGKDDVGPGQRRQSRAQEDEGAAGLGAQKLAQRGFQAASPGRSTRESAANARRRRSARADTHEPSSSPATAVASRLPFAGSRYSACGGRPETSWRSTMPAASSCSRRSESVVGETPGRDWRNSLKRAAPLEQA